MVNVIIASVLSTAQTCEITHHTRSFPVHRHQSRTQREYDCASLSDMKRVRKALTYTDETASGFQVG